MNDSDLIDSMGGPAAVAKLLNIQDEHAVQRVFNWKKRGIPARVLLDHRLIFDRARRAKASRDNEQPQGV